MTDFFLWKTELVFFYFTDDDEDGTTANHLAIDHQEAPPKQTTTQDNTLGLPNRNRPIAQFGQTFQLNFYSLQKLLLLTGTIG